MRYQKNQCNKNKGAILTLMVLLILLFSLSSMALVAVARESRIRTVKNVSDISARFAADAGIERALYLMNAELEAGSWTLDDVPTYSAESLTACNAEYTLTFDGDLASGYQVTSVGRSGLATKTVRATIELSSPFADDFAVLTKADLQLKNKAQVKGYNSADPGDTNVPVAIGTLNDEDDSIVLKNDSEVNGDVYVPPESDPDQIVDDQNNDSITGNIFIMPTLLNLPTITAPDFTGSSGTISGSNITLTTSDSGKYSKIDISTKGKLTVNGDVVLYITGDIELNNQAELEVTDGSTLKIYFDGDFEAKNSSEINNVSQIPGAVRLYGTGTDQEIDLKNSSDIHGVVYAPNARMTIHNKVNAYGSFIVGEFEMKNSGDIYYDKALKETSLSDEAIYFTVTHWEEL